MTEKDIQTYLYDHLHDLPQWIGISSLKEKYLPNRDDLINNPVKYLLYQKYQKIFQLMDVWDFQDADILYKFPLEYKTAQVGKSIPRVDILAYTHHESIFWICEIKLNKDPERQTLTELLQYANGLQCNDFPWLTNNNIIFIIIAKEWSNILIQSVSNCMFFRGINILTLTIPDSVNSVADLVNYKIAFYDLTNTWAFAGFARNIYDEENYAYRLIAFDDLHKKEFNVSNSDKQLLSSSIANEYSKLGYNGSVIFLEDNSNWHMYRFILSIIYFNPFRFENNMIPLCNKRDCRAKCEMIDKSESWNDIEINRTCSYIDKIRLLEHFHNEMPWYDINENNIKAQIGLMFPGHNISFESWYEWWYGMSWISRSGHLFSYAYPIGWFHELTTQAINNSRKDPEWWRKFFDSDDFMSNDEIYSWWYLSKFFESFQ